MASSASKKKTKAESKPAVEKETKVEEKEKAIKAVSEATEEQKKTRTRKTASTKSKTSTTAKKEVAHTTIVEFDGNAVDVDDIVKRAESAFKNDNKRKRYDEFFVYIKPEDEKAYYVAKYGDKEYKDSVPLF